MQAKNFKTIASSPTLEGLTKCINSFYYSTTFYIQDMKVYNSKGLRENMQVVQKKGRYYFQILIP